jgi:hypothetical protein
LAFNISLPVGGGKQAQPYNQGRGAKQRDDICGMPGRPQYA